MGLEAIKHGLVFYRFLGSTCQDLVIIPSTAGNTAIIRVHVVPVMPLQGIIEFIQSHMKYSLIKNQKA